MNKKLLLCLIASTVLLGCDKAGNNTGSSDSNNTGTSETNSSEVLPPREYYATINSKYDIVYVYGVVGGSFDLTSIDVSRCCAGTPTFSYSGDGLQISNNTMKYLEKGTYVVDVNYNGLKICSLQVLVSADEESRLQYPHNIDLNEYTQHSGLPADVVVKDDAITLTSTSQWTRIIYDLDEAYSTNYSVECDVTFLSASDPTRWFGIVFRDQETRKDKYPFYQFDLRKKTNSANSIEITNYYGNDAYSYPYSGMWTNEGPKEIALNEKIHVKFSLKDAAFSGVVTYGDYSTTVEAILPNVTKGGFGFQCAGSSVKFENINVTLDDSIKVMSNANKADSIVYIDDDAVDGLKPHMIASGKTIDEFFGVYIDAQQFFVKAKDLELYNINDEKMDVTLNDILLELLGLYIPNIQVEDLKTLDDIIAICNSYAVYDLVIWSTNGEILDAARSKLPHARLGYIPTNLTSLETYEEVGNLCHAAGKHYANMILVDSELLNKENIIKATSLGYSIVANAKDGDNYSVVSSALTGCKLILANYNKNVQTQANLIYDDDLFTVDETNANVAYQVHSLFSVPYATGHRGAGTNGTNPEIYLPENTIESFEWAYTHGAQAIEIDVHTTADGKLAVIHDGTTGAYSNQNLTVANTTLAKLQELPLYIGSSYSYDYHIPSLEEVLTAFSGEEYKDKAIVIEIKDNLHSTGVHVVEVCKAMGWYNRISLITFSAATAKSLRDYDPGIQVGYLNTVYRRNSDEYWSSVDSFLSMGVGLASQLTTITTDPLQESNARGQMYWLWTFDYGNAAQLASLICDGNRAYTTNYINFFSHNKYRLLADDNITLSNGETKKLTAKSITYMQEEAIEDNVDIIVLSGNATVSGNSITRTGSGDICVVLKHRTTWTIGSTRTDFCIYSDIVTIK